MAGVIEENDVLVAHFEGLRDRVSGASPSWLEELRSRALDGEDVGLAG